MATIPCEAIPREVPVAKPPKKPAPLDVEPPLGPVVHAKPVRPPTERLPHWYWRAVVYDTGAERTVWTGRGSRDDVRAAVWGLIGRGEHIAQPLESLTPDDMVVVAFETVSDLLTHWRAHLQDGQSGLAPNTVLTYCRHSRPLEEVLGQVLLEQLGRRELDRYRAAVALPPPESSRRTRPRSTGSINCDFITLRAAWSWGRSIGAVDRDLQVPTVTVQPTRDNYTPTADEVAAVVEHLSGWVADVVRVQWATGCRVGEVLALHVEDIDLEGLRIDVGRHIGAQKTGRRQVPIDASAAELLRGIIGDRLGRAPVWPQASSQRRMAEAVAKACTAAGVPVWTSHGLRRAFVTRGLRAKVPLEVMASITGHSIPVMLRIYRQVQDDDRREAVALLPSSLPSVAAGNVRPFQRRR
jgi:integrase